jgi:cell division protein FtsB
MPRSSLLATWIADRWRGWVLPGLVALLMLYTADQLLTGERGMLTWRVMRSQITELRTNINTLHAEIANLNGRIDRLKGLPLVAGGFTPPDKDFVDELLRRDLGLLKDSEAVILTAPLLTPNP